MEKETGEEGSKGFSRREILQAALAAVAAAAVSKIASKSQGLENTQGGEPVPPRRWMPYKMKYYSF